MFSGFVFDVEGTLVDSVLQSQLSLQNALESVGFRVPLQTIQLYTGLDVDQILQLVVPEAAEEERREIRVKQELIYERDYLPSVEPFDDVRDVFSILTGQGGRIALATDCKGLAFKRYKELLDVDDYIAATACGDDVEHGKPDPRLVGMALRKLALSGPQVVMIGDTPYDVEAGLEAGTKAAAVLTGGFPESTLREAGCFAAAPDLKSLLPGLLFGDGQPGMLHSNWLRSA
jgi:HAD superfamily hydrolase (TIGR01549 family)